MTGKKTAEELGLDLQQMDRRLSLSQRAKGMTKAQLVEQLEQLEEHRRLYRIREQENAQCS